MTGNVQEWEEMDDEPGLMDEAGNSLVHYCKEYIQNKPKAGLTFTANLLMDYHDLQQEKPDENYAAESHPWSDKMKWIDAGDCYPLYLLTSAILGQTDLNEDEVYENLCDQVLPVVVQELNDNNLYPGSQLETLINLLDYAYRDLQSPEDEKLAALYNEMASDDFLHLEAADLFPYFTQPYAVLHSDCDDMQVIWAYSFWARRWNDGCISLCRRILDKILETWPNKTCTTATMTKTEQYYRANRRNSNYSREELLQELENAFADAPRPEVKPYCSMRWKSANPGRRSEKYSAVTPGRKSLPLRSTKMQRRYRASPPKDSGITCRLFSQKRSGTTIRKKIFSLLYSVPLLISGCLRNMDGIISPFSPPDREKQFTIASNGGRKP